MSSKEHSDPKFREAVDMQWEKSIRASMTPSIETILTSQTILKWNLQKNGNLIREHAGIHRLPLQSTGILPEIW